jgi:hypothetical protein
VTRWEQAWAADVLTAFTAEASQGLAPGASEVDYLTTFRRMRRGSTALAALGLRLALWMVALAPLWLLGRIATISSLARRDRTELLRRLLAHRVLAVRELTMLLKLTAAMALLGTSSVRARSGYDSTTTRAEVQRVHLPLAQPAQPERVSLPAATTQPNGSSEGR